MNFKEIIDKVETLRTQGIELGCILDYLSSHKAHHTPAIYAIAAVYNLTLIEVEKLFSEHSWYKDKINEVNPFNEDFFNGISEEE